MTKSIKKSIVLCAILGISTLAKAQLSGGDAFIKANSVEIGVELNGGHEGANAAAPGGYHFRGGFGLSGFVADPLVGGWANYMGDYFTPGSPENGWGLLIGNTTGGIQKSNNNGIADINTGSVLAYSHIGTCFNVDWSGSVTSGTTNIKASINYFVEDANLYYTTTVTLKNNSAGIIPELYYYRNVDPDNNESLPGGSFVTDQKIENQSTSDPCLISCVSATQAPIAGGCPSYLGFAGVGPDFRVTYGGFGNRNGFDIWNGLAPFTQAVGSTNTNDEAISIAYKIINFLPGTSRTFKFVVILNSSAKVQALDNLLALTYPGSAFLPPAACAVLPPPDTARICSNSMIGITGPTTSYYSWSWAPPTGISSSTSATVIANPTTTTVYTITGTPLGACSPTTPVSYTLVVIPLPSTVVINPPITVCVGLPIFLSSGLATGGISSVYSWIGPGGYTSATQNNTITPSTLANSGTYTVSNEANCTSALTTVSVTPRPTLTITATSNTLCVNNSATLTVNCSSTSGYTWTPGATLSSTSTSVTVASPMTTITYTAVVGAGSCTNSAVKTITVIPSPIIGAISGTNTVCGLCTGIITASASAGLSPYQYSWSPSSSTQSVVTDLCPGNYSVTITDANNCKAKLTYSVMPSPIFQASVTASTIQVFQGEIVNLTGIGGGTYTWSPSTSLSCLNCANTIATPLDDITYCVDVTSTDGCRDSACVDIFVKCGDVFIPNAFSPNNDGHNDELQVYGNCIKDLVFRVYDRWGEMVFECYDVKTKWDGKYKGYSVNAGVFVYQLSAKLKSGDTVTKKGNITVVK